MVGGSVRNPVAEVPYAEVILRGMLGNQPIAGVFAMEPRLVAIEQTAGSNQRDLAFGQRLQRRPWRHAFVHDPSVGRIATVKFTGSGYVRYRHAEFLDDC